MALRCTALLSGTVRRVLYRRHVEFCYSSTIEYIHPTRAYTTKNCHPIASTVRDISFVSRHLHDIQASHDRAA